jgi:hypothetical protein
MEMRDRPGRVIDGTGICIVIDESGADLSREAQSALKLERATIASPARRDDDRAKQDHALVSSTGIKCGTRFREQPMGAEFLPVVRRVAARRIDPLEAGSLRAGAGKKKPLDSDLRFG